MIRFDEDTHTYTNENGEKLISTTQLMRKHGLAPDYSNVSQEVLKVKAMRGTLIHKEIEDFNKNGELGFTNEVHNFKDYCEAKNIKVIESEYIVNNDIVAGTIDLILDENGEQVIADIKTTSTLHKDSVSWQLSIYAYLSGRDIKKGQAFHFDSEGELKVVDIPLKPRSEVEKLMNAERNGEDYKQELVVSENLLQQLTEIEIVIANIENQKKEAEQQAKTLREALLSAMEQNAVKAFENERIKLTYVEPIERSTIDTARLKKELPEVAKTYEKTSKTKASLRITLKEIKNDENI